MKGPKALLSLFKTMTIYEGPEGVVVTLSRPPISNRTYMLQTYSLMACQSIPLLGQIQAIRFITFSVHIS